MNKFSPKIDLSDIRIYEQQYKENYRQLKYYGMQFINDEEIVCDIIQDVWLKIWEKQDTYQSEKSFKSYLFHSLRNTIINYINKQALMQKYINQYNRKDIIQEPVYTKIIEAEIYQILNKTFEELPNICRKVYAESLEGKTQKEIANKYNITINTVKKHINNANHYLKIRLKKSLLFFLLF